MRKRLEERVNTYGRYLKSRYGKRIFRVGLSLNMECPHRLKTGGCTFCLPESFTDKALNGTYTPAQQLEKIIPKIKKGCGDVGFLAYFHDNTSTFGNVQELKQIYKKTLKHTEIKGLIISTRPDFLNDEIMKMLKDLQEDVFLEIGLQSIHQHSLDFLNRGHAYHDLTDAFGLCEKYQIETGVHVILGIPGESIRDMISTIEFINELDIISQIKFHNLVVYRDTPLAAQPEEIREAIPSLEEYLTILGTILQHTKGNKIISRFFTSNVNKNNLALNPFPGIKRDWQNRLTAFLGEQDIIQGSATSMPYKTIN